jgi:hypothetical protein
MQFSELLRPIDRQAIAEVVEEVNRLKGMVEQLIQERQVP